MTLVHLEPVADRTHLDDDLLAELLGRRHLSRFPFDRLSQEQILENFLKVISHLALLRQRAVVLDR